MSSSAKDSPPLRRPPAPRVMRVRDLIAELRKLDPSLPAHLVIGDESTDDVHVGLALGPSGRTAVLADRSVIGLGLTLRPVVLVKLHPTRPVLAFRARQGRYDDAIAEVAGRVAATWLPPPGRAWELPVGRRGLLETVLDGEGFRVWWLS